MSSSSVLEGVDGQAESAAHKPWPATPHDAKAGVWRHRAGLVLMLASGFAGLGYQLVWAQQCALWLGHESVAVLAVVAAFFGGIALGALLLGRRIEASANPLHWYVACELAIAAWALALLGLMQPFSDALLSMIGTQPSPVRQWTLAFGGTLLLLLPATMAMGATLPAMSRMMLRETQGRGQRSIAAWYASNTLGAVLGVLATAFWLVPEIGLRRTLMVCALLNTLCAVAALAALRRQEDVSLTGAATPAPHGRFAWSMLLAGTGLLGIGYEVLVVRVLSQVAEDTVYTFAMLLAVYLVGTALGAAAYQRWLARAPARQPHLTAKLLGVLATACLLGTASLWAAGWWQDTLRGMLGEGMSAAIAAEAGGAVLAFALPTCLMGALFSHLSAQAEARGLGFGRALAANTFGGALAPAVFGVWLAPAMGPKAALILLGMGYAGLVGLNALAHPGRGAAVRQPGTPQATSPAASRTPAWHAVLPTALALILAVFAPPLAFVDIPEGGRLVSYSDGSMAAVSVMEDSEGVARLRINNRQQEGSSATLMVDGRQAMLPMLLHPAPRRALFLGLGTGVTSGTAAEDPSLAVDAVELLPEVIEASRHFARVFDREVPNERLHVMAADARRYVRTTTAHYDLIVSDNFHPARSGSGALYTVEHFRAIKARLNAEGLFCQWLPLHQLDMGSLRSIVSAFMQVFPRGVAILANNSVETPVIGLVGRHDDGLFDAQALQRRLARHGVPRPPSSFGLDSELAVLGSVMAGPEALTRFSYGIRANTDDLPVVAYTAPRIAYTAQSRPAERLLALMDEWHASPGEVLADTGQDAAFAKRLVDYWAARERFIRAGMRVRPTGDVREMLAHVREPLLDVLRTSADFRPAYDPLIGMAMALAQQGGQSDVAEARALLTDLTRLQPAWPQAGQALRRLSAAP